MLLSFLVGLLFISAPISVTAATTTSVVIATAPAIADAPLAPTSTEDLIKAAAAQYGLNYDHFYRTLRCESGLNTNAIGDHGTSLGVAQIHLPAHPEITRQEAMNGRWSIDWAAEQFAAGNAHEWSCYNLLFG